MELGNIPPMEREQSYQQRRSRVPLLASVIVLLLVILVAFNLHAIKDQLNSWKLLPEPQKLTELYFNSPNKLPDIYVPGQSETLGFTVHNLEYKNVNYSYQVVERSLNSNKSINLVKGTFDLEQNDYKSVNLSLVPVNVGSKAEITVKLTNVNESIDYLLDRGDT